MKRCSFCSHENSEDTRFCRNCGRPFNQSQNSQIQSSPTVPPTQIKQEVNRKIPAQKNSSTPKKRLSGAWIAIIILSCLIFGCCLFGFIGLVFAPSSDKTSTNGTITSVSTTNKVTKTPTTIPPQTTTPSQTEIITPTQTPVPEVTTEETLSRDDQKEFIKNAVITLEDSRMTGPDSAGGLSFDIDVKNKSESEIKYVYIEVVVLNAVGDILRSDTDFDESPAVTLTMTGPIAPGEVGGLGRTWKCAFYTTTASSWGINQVAIEYTSGLTVILDREDCILLQETYIENHS